MFPSQVKEIRERIPLLPPPLQSTHPSTSLLSNSEDFCYANDFCFEGAVEFIHQRDSRYSIDSCCNRSVSDIDCDATFRLSTVSSFGKSNNKRAITSKLHKDKYENTLVTRPAPQPPIVKPARSNQNDAKSRIEDDVFITTLLDCKPSPSVPLPTCIRLIPDDDISKSPITYPEYEEIWTSCRIDRSKHKFGGSISKLELIDLPNDSHQ